MILIPKAKIDHFTAQGWWGQKTLWDVFVAHCHTQPHAEAVADAPNRTEFAHGSPQRLTWAQLADEVDSLCLALLQCGVKRDDMLALQLPNCVEQFVAYLACARLGVIATPVPVQYREHELGHVLAKSRAVAALTLGRIGKPDAPHQAAAMFMGLKAQHPALKTVLAWGEGSATVNADIHLPDCTGTVATRLSSDQLAQVQQAASAAQVTANDVFTLCWTSGTEATPKGVPRSHNEWLVIAPSIIEAAGLQAGARLLNPFPLVNMAGISTAFATWLMLGGTVVQHHPFSLPVFLQQLREERIDYTVAPPAVLNLLLQNDQYLAGIDFKRLSRIGSGSAPLSDWMVRGFQDKYGVQIVNYFGSNEGAALTGSSDDIPDPALRAAFFPRAGVDGFTWAITTTRKIKTRLVDLDTGAEIIAPGQPGEIRFAGPTIFSGYYEAPELTASAFDDQGFYRTGDLFEIAGDQHQYYRYVGRSKDLVIRGGVNLSSEEIENLLQSCPGVREVAVVGVPDAMLGEKVCACVVPAVGHSLTLQALADYLRLEKKVAVYKLPEYLLTVASLPRNPVGKILKRELREQAKSLANTNANRGAA